MFKVSNSQMQYNQGHCTEKQISKLNAQFTRHFIREYKNGAGNAEGRRCAHDPLFAPEPAGSQRLDELRAHRDVHLARCQDEEGRTRLAWCHGTPRKMPFWLALMEGNAHELVARGLAGIP